MKFFISLGILITINFSSISQISLESNDLFVSEDTIRLSQASNSTIDFSITGPNSLWDYSNLEAITQSLFDPKFVSNASLPIQLKFGSFAPQDYQSDYYTSYAGLPLDQLSNFLPVNIEDVYRFTKVESDSATYTGLALLINGTEIPFQSDSIEEFMRFPMTFLDSFSDRAYTKIDFNPIFNGIFIQYRQRSSFVDGFGTIITPFGTFDALRVVHEINEQDSLFTDLLGFPTWIPLELPTKKIYEFWSKSELIPILKIETQLINGIENTTLVEYKDFYRGLTNGIEINNNELNYFPNPTCDMLKINSLQLLKSIEIIDEIGNIVYAKATINYNSMDLDLSTLQSGLYSMKIETKNKITFHPVLICNY